MRTIQISPQLADKLTRLVAVRQPALLRQARRGNAALADLEPLAHDWRSDAAAKLTNAPTLEASKTS